MAEDKPERRGRYYSGGENRFNVYNWLEDIPLGDLDEPFPIVEVSFNNGSRKDFFTTNESGRYKRGDYVTVEGGSGFDVGVVSLSGELVKWQLRKKKVKMNSKDLKRILHLANDRELQLMAESKAKEHDYLVRSREIVKTHGLKMKMTDIEVQADHKKVSFYYTADARIDFRELIKTLASEFKAKIEMRQIGLRQESARIGGIGTCGLELCSCSWLEHYKHVSLSTIKSLNLPISTSKMTGSCGHMKCCLAYELDMYVDALKKFPKEAKVLRLANGEVHLHKKDIFRDLMWYCFADSSKQYPLSIERVREIRELNKKGIYPDELKPSEVVSHRKPEGSEANLDLGFVNDVGQITLDRLGTKKKKKKKKQGKRNDKTPVAQMEGRKRRNNNGSKSQNGRGEQKKNRKKTNPKPN